MKPFTKMLKVAPLWLLGIGIGSAAYGQNLSDSEIKKNVHNIEAPIQKVLKLEPKSFEYDTQHYKHLNFQSGTHYGFLAENVASVFPELVKTKTVSYNFGKNSTRDAKVKTVEEHELISVLVAAIKEQQTLIEKLQADLQQIKSKVTVPE